MVAKKGDKHPNHVGNQCWKMRTKSGRDKLFSSTPEGTQAFLDLCNEYFQKPRPQWVKKEFIKSGPGAGTIIDIEIDAPYTIEELCQHLQIDSRTFRNYRGDEAYKEFFPIFTYVDHIIRINHTQGGLLNLLNPMLVSRIQGYKDQQDITSDGKQITPIINVSNPDISNILNKG